MGCTYLLNIPIESPSPRIGCICGRSPDLPSSLDTPSRFHSGIVSSSGLQ